MKKVCFLIIFSLITVLFVSTYIYYFRDCIIINSVSDNYLKSFLDDNKIMDKNNRGVLDEKENAIANEETALAIGRSVLKEHFPDIYNDIKKDFIIKDFGKLWVIYNETSVSRYALRNSSIKNDGCVYVFIEKFSGEIINIGIGL